MTPFQSIEEGLRAIAALTNGIPQPHRQDFDAIIGRCHFTVECDGTMNYAALQRQILAGLGAVHYGVRPIMTEVMTASPEQLRQMEADLGVQA